MQFKITDEAALTFGHALYEAIANGYPLDAATTEARIAVLADGNLTEWGTPVLYLRAPDGRIFDIQPPSAEQARLEAAEQQAPREAAEQARQAAEERAQREAPAEQQTRWRAEAEEQAWRLAEAEEQARRQTEEQARREEKAEPKIIAVVDENVQFTVYRPSAVQAEVWYPLLAFAHLAERRPDAPPGQPDPIEQVREMAVQVLGEEAAYGAPRVDARGGVPREGQLTFVPFVEGMDFNPRSQTFEWQEDVHQQNFRLRARADTAGSVLRGQLTVYLGAFILADIDLTFWVDLAAPPPPTPTVRRTLLDTSSASPTPPQPELTPATAVPYQSVFPSYSHKDLAIVRQAELYGKALGHVYLRDRLALRTGEEWEVRLLELIDKADIFQLFWSSNSMRSEYVRREWEHAQALGRPGFVRPTYWEVPMPQSTNPPLPPDDLAKLHFHGFYEEPPREHYEEPPRAYYREPPREDYREPPREDYEEPPRAHYREPPRAPPRRRRRISLGPAILAVLVALAIVVFLLRGCAS
jgi:hypothetical protein